MLERVIIQPTPEQIGYPVATDPLRWAKHLIAKSNWDEIVAKQFRLSARNLGLANRIEAIRGDDSNIFSFHKFADVIPFDIAISQNAGDSLVLRTDWELSGQLPAHVRTILELLQKHTRETDWTDKSQIEPIHQVFLASRAMINSFISNNQRLQEILAYRATKIKILEPYWQAFEQDITQ